MTHLRRREPCGPSLGSHGFESLSGQPAAEQEYLPLRRAPMVGQKTKAPLGGKLSVARKRTPEVMVEVSNGCVASFIRYLVDLHSAHHSRHLALDDNK
jgi:hypothetical protein